MWENRSSGFPTRSDTNRAVQPQKMTRGYEFRIKVEEGLYYPYSENKGADQLRSYCAAALRLNFQICKIPFSHDEAHMLSTIFYQEKCGYPKFRYNHSLIKKNISYIHKPFKNGVLFLEY